MMPNHDWIELDDHYNMKNESEIEPDYYIDRPPSATYIPDEEGTDQAIQVHNYDADLFDYEMEVEPILQVLVGKALEQARIEVIESYENAVLAKHNAQYKQKREAMLVQTQRVEARQNRHNDEIDRRNLQQRVNQVIQEGREKRELATVMSKQYLRFFKRDTLQQLKDIGLLRSKKEYSMGSHFVPALYNQIKLEMIEEEDKQKLIEETVQSGLGDRARKHKRAIQAEMQRREDIKNEKLRQEAEAKRAKERRQERRMCLREQKRIQELADTLQLAVIPQAELRDFSGAATCPVYDVRDYKLAIEGGPGIFAFGGLIGEVMISLSAFYETMITRMEMPSFEIRRDQILKFLEDLLFDGFSPEVCYIRVTDDMLS